MQTSNKKFFKELAPYKAPIIAEMANTHCGDFKKLVKLVNIVSKSDTSILKFQIFKTHERAEKNTKEWSIFSKLEFSEIEWRKIIKLCKKKNYLLLLKFMGKKV